MRPPHGTGLCVLERLRLVLTGPSDLTRLPTRLSCVSERPIPAGGLPSRESPSPTLTCLRKRITQGTVAPPYNTVTTDRTEVSLSFSSAATCSRIYSGSGRGVAEKKSRLPQPLRPMGCGPRPSASEAETPHHHYSPCRPSMDLLRVQLPHRTSWPLRAGTLETAAGCCRPEPAVQIAKQAPRKPTLAGESEKYETLAQRCTPLVATTARLPAPRRKMRLARCVRAHLASLRGMVVADAENAALRDVGRGSHNLEGGWPGRREHRVVHGSPSQNLTTSPRPDSGSRRISTIPVRRRTDRGRTSWPAHPIRP